MIKILQRVILLSLIILSIVALTSCATLSYKVQSKYDKFDNTTHNYMLYNWLGNQSLSSDRFSFDLGEYIQEDTTNYYINIIYWGNDWFFIESGESLILLVDGKRISFSGEGSYQSREVITGNLVSEFAYYDITKEGIETLVNAKSIEVKIIGEYSTTLYFTKENLERIKSFYNQFIK